jgi:peptide/nickel transport system permease protein
VAMSDKITLLPKEKTERLPSTSRWLTVRALLRDPVTFFATLVLALILVSAAGAELVAPHDPLQQDLNLRNIPPMSYAKDDNDLSIGRPFILGTDPLGRDVLSRMIFGARVSLTVGLSSALVSGLIGTLLGIIAGFYRGAVDDLIMRLVDIQMSIPVLLLALLVLFALGPGFLNLVVVLAIVRWMAYARLARGQTLAFRNLPFIDAAVSIGSSNSRIIFRHILPNVASSLIILSTLEVATLILSEAGLSFLGFGIQLPQPSWGLMISGGRQYIATAWWNVAFPGLVIFLTTLSLNLLAASLRSINDPMQRERWFRKRNSSSDAGG